MEIVKAVGLKKYYITETYEVRALDDVSLSIADGEFLADGRRRVDPGKQP